MSYHKFLILTLTLSSFTGTILGCIEKNITCEEIKQAAKYRYPHKCTSGSKVHVTVNETKIAYGKLGSDPSTYQYQHKHMEIVNGSFLTENCSDLTIKCTSEEGDFAKDLCWIYKILEKTPESSDSNQGPIIGASVVLLVIIIGICVGIYHYWKKKVAASLFCLCKDSQGISRNGMSATQSASDYCDDNERNHKLASQRPQDPQAGETPDTLSQTSIDIEEETQAKDGGTNVFDEVPRGRDMHRNQRDDPGGVNRIKADDSVGTKKMQNGWTHGERDPEDDDEQDKKNESEPLLLIQGANQHSDMTGEATVLVDKNGFNPDHDGKDSITLDSDVESAHYAKNIRINKY